VTTRPDTAGLLLLLSAAVVAQGQILTPVWTELGSDGDALARVVVSRLEECPGIVIDGANRTMAPRQPVPDGFRPVCEAAIPAGAKSAQVNGRLVAIPSSDPASVVVIGDTGCRIKGDVVQACDDPAKWPFARVVAAASAVRPQIVIHVGDYLYREDKCPPNKQSQCAGPNGDNWNAWNADFFAPATKLLSAAPWVFARGNHESCKRAWKGFFYYLSPRPWTGACPESQPPYTAQSGSLQLVIFDTSSASETVVDPVQLDTYISQLATIHATHAWLVGHHPFFGVRAGAKGEPPVAQTEVLQQAWDNASPSGIDLILSGHTHLFELLSFGTGHPLQIVAGDGGTQLSNSVPEHVNGMDVHGLMVAASENQHQFGYTLLTRTGADWVLALKTTANQTAVTCRIQGLAEQSRQFQCGRVAK
jgi:hypothetical protein